MNSTLNIWLVTFLVLISIPLSIFAEYPSVVCFNDTILYTIRGNDGSNFKWDIPNGEILSLSNQGDSIVVAWNINQGNCSIAVTEISKYGCNYDSKTVNLYVHKPDLHLTDTIEICEGESQILTLDNTYSQYIWNNEIGNNEYQIRNEGTLLLEIEDNTGCWIKDSIIVIEHYKPRVELGNDTVLCANNDFEIDAGYQNNHLYRWNTDATTHSINIIESGIYSVTTTNEFQCKDVDSIFVQILNKPEPDFTAEQDSTTLSVSLNNLTVGNWDYLWYFGNGDSIAKQEPLKYTYQNYGSYTIQLTAFNGKCKDTFERNIDVKPLLKSIFTSPVEGCAPLRVSLVNSSVGATTYSWDFGDGENTTGVNPAHTYYEPGSYRISLKAENEFGDDIQSEMITVYETPIAQFEVYPQTVTVSEKIDLINTSQYATQYLWHFGNGDTSQIEEPRYKYPNPGMYDITLVAISENGCSDSFQANNSITVKPDCQLLFPDGFIPNKTGPSGGYYDKNITAENIEIFHPLHERIEEYHLEIYNRWGKLVFQSDDVNIGWDGYYKGRLSNQDTYIYIVKAKCNSGRDMSKTGSVILIR